MAKAKKRAKLSSKPGTRNAVYAAPRERVGFLDLPLELRNQIYEYSRPGPRQHFVKRGSMTYAMNMQALWKFNWTQPLLLINRQIRTECLALLYTRMTPVMQMDAFHRKSGLPDTLKWLDSFGSSLAALRLLCFCAKLSEKWIVKFEIDLGVSQQSVTWLLGDARWQPPFNNWKAAEEIEHPRQPLNTLKRDMEVAMEILRQMREAGFYRLQHLKLFIDVFFVRCNTFVKGISYKVLESKEPLKQLRALQKASLKTVAQGDKDEAATGGENPAGGQDVTQNEDMAGDEEACLRGK